jgi:ABC-type multidrug transport system ATPase subunit
MSQKNVEGIVTLNGTPLQSINEFHHLVGLVPKEDELHPNLTIKVQ